MIKAIFLDLDNTIYPVSSISSKLFKKLFAHIENKVEFTGDIEDLKEEIQRTPFQKVAKDFLFSQQLLDDCLRIHTNLSYDLPIKTFDDYKELRDLPQKKYLITSGFTKLQNNKVKQLGIKNDFDAIYILDLQQSKQTKKDIFQQILIEQNFDAKEVLIVGDDLSSEIQAGKELGIETVLYNKLGKYSELENQNVITDFKELKNFL